jgi:hypothetical protein
MHIYSAQKKRSYISWLSLVHNSRFLHAVMLPSIQPSIWPNGPS